MGRSIRLRFLLGAALTLFAALGLAGVALMLVFEGHVERRVAIELDTMTRQIAANLEVGADGKARLERQLADPRLEIPVSGLYWQIREAGAVVEASRSLWDFEIVAPTGVRPSAPLHQYVATGPNSSRLAIVERSVTITDSGKDRVFEIAAALDRAEVTAAVRNFVVDLVWSLALLGTLLLAAAVLQVTVGLEPLRVIKDQVSKIRSGASPRLGGDLPKEVTPLADEINALLDAKELSITRARTRAGDLAHGLKTPLSVLLAVSRKLTVEGNAAAARDIDEQVETMQHHVDRHLAQARIAGDGAAATPLARSTEKIVETMRRLPRGTEIEWELAVPTDLEARIEPADFNELAGNLIDNARKWARSKVRIAAERKAGETIVSFEDDGPGVPADKRDAIRARGASLDEQRAGAGLGLAIAGDIMAAYGGAMTLYEAPLGGLGVRVALRAGG